MLDDFDEGSSKMKDMGGSLMGNDLLPVLSALIS